MSEKADHVYDVDHWEATYPADMLNELTEDLPFDTVMVVGRLKELPSVYAVQVVTEWDDEGEPVDWEVKTYPTREAAEAAMKIKAPAQ